MPDVSYSIGGVRNEQQTEADRTRARMAQMMFEKEMRDRAEAVARQNAQLGADLTREGWTRQDAASERGLGFQRDMLNTQAKLARYGMDREDARSERGLAFQQDMLNATLSEQRAGREADMQKWEKMFGAQEADRAIGREAAGLSLADARARAAVLAKLQAGADPDSLTSYERTILGVAPSAVAQVKKEEELVKARAGTTMGRRDLLKEQEQGFQAIGKGVAGETYFSGSDATKYATQAGMLIDRLRQSGADDKAIEAAKNRLINEINLGTTDWMVGSGGPQLQALIRQIQGL